MSPPPVLALGFRVFFLLAVAHAVGAMGLWIAALEGLLAPGLAGLPAVSWHGHEMVYGFSRAVVAGFLLTAVRNWTGRPTPTGWPLGVLAALWLIPRLLLAFGGPSALGWAAAFDLAFSAGLVTAIATPIVAVRQTRQAGILTKLVLLGVGEALFYAGAAGWLDQGVAWGLGTGTYMVLALVLTIARRVFVFFVRSALPGSPPPPERPWLDRASLIGFLLLYLLDVFTPWDLALSVVAAVLAVLHGFRLWTWWVPGVASRALLWVLFAAYGWIVVGFVLHALTPWLDLAPAIALHAYTAGGIGTITLGMVARVSLGHTGRDVREPRPFLGWVFAGGIAAAAFRVLGPWLAPAWKPLWLDAAATLWIAAFGALLVWGLPLWLRPRPDGQPG